MKEARFHFSQIHRRDPQLDELLLHYETVFQTHSADRDRISRAERALKRSTFDITAATDGGYLHQRDHLLGAINAHVQMTQSNDITAEDCAIYLYAVTMSSFKISDDPKLQWTCNYDLVGSIFDAIKPLTGRGGRNRNKLKRIRDILERAGLIECQNRGYIIGQAAQKWTISHHHPRYAEFVRFFEKEFQAPPPHKNAATEGEWKLLSPQPSTLAA